MDSVITGKVWKFGDDINTDIISPAEYMDASYEVIGKHAMERAFPGFADAIARGDIIVAGKNFGSGSSRDQQYGYALDVDNSFGPATQKAWGEYLAAYILKAVK